MKLIRYTLPMLAIVLCFGLLGAEAAGEIVQLTKAATTVVAVVAAPAADVSVIPTWAVSIVTVIAGLMGTYAAFCVAKLINLIFGQKWQDGAKGSAITALQHGIQDAEEELVAELKNDTSDGKLTAAEIQRAKQLAYKRALEVASGPALDLLKQWGIDMAGNLISQLIQGKKTAGNTVVVNTASVDSIQAPVNTTLQVPVADATAATTAAATVVKAVVNPKPTQEEIESALKVLEAANHH